MSVTKFVTSKNVAIALGVGQQLLPTISKLLGDIGTNSKAKEDLEKLRLQIQSLDASHENYKLEVERRETALYWVLGALPLVAFVAGLAVAYLAFRFQFIKLV